MSGDYTNYKNESRVRLTEAVGHPRSMSRDMSVENARHREWDRRTQSQFSFVEPESEKSHPAKFADRFLRRGKKNIGILTSLKRIALSSGMLVSIW
jgi:hypothetical protein